MARMDEGMALERRIVRLEALTMFHPDVGGPFSRHELVICRFN